MFDVSYNDNPKANHANKTRLGFVTGFSGTEKSYNAWVEKNRANTQKEGKDATTAAGGTLPPPSLTSLHTSQVHGYDYHSERAIGLTSNADIVKREGKLEQENKGDCLPDLRTIIRWVNADQSTMLHEFGHLFLDMRINLIRGLKGRTDLIEGQRHLAGYARRSHA